MTIFETFKPGDAVTDYKREGFVVYESIDGWWCSTKPNGKGQYWLIPHQHARELYAEKMATAIKRT